MMNLLHWRLLLAVEECGTVTAAAERQGMTQSGASQAIRQMEEALGIVLFVRDRRQTLPTALGQQVLRKARAMLAELDGIRSLADEGRGLLSGRVTVAGFPSLFARLLARKLDQFRLRHPGLEVLWLDGSDEEIEHWLACGQVDIGVVLNPAAARPTQQLGEDTWLAVLPNSHRLARRHAGQPVYAHELANEPFIVATGGCRLHGESVLEAMGARLNDVRMRVRDWGSALEMARGGLGATVMPASVLPDPCPGVRAFALADAPPRRFALACSAAGAASPQAKALLDWLSER
ncbi:LysR family transcriptional regulator [Chromobacterium sp. IIBBL 290-4]|uniref:LysR family transcriptional regulator n=1 Tax=Chromobacterium sp. IIBBL 290-4 TaxID=2953890 RepID=UPI0020B8FD1D|nr:LysR family transcriptional regulator [Chromobacterium sp. IIBBL 290-4]UTH75993.1 LysR family transcriptional regulator [Chromobacterium sp. IIBBL 290-4]